MTMAVGKTQAASQTAADWRGYWRKLGPMGWVGEVLKYIILLVLGATFVLPFFWMVTSALKDNAQIYRVPPIWIPNPAHWNNFWDAWTMQNFNLYTANTVFKYALPATIGAVLSCAIVAYGFARLRWPGRDLLFGVCLATMMVPSQVTMVPLFITFRHMGWINTYLPLVVPSFFGSAYFIFMLRQFFMTIPSELSDAARIDGANEFGILWRIILPLARPALTVVALFRFMDAWNDYFGPLVYVNHMEQWPIALGIEHIQDGLYSIGFNRMGFPYLMAISAIVTVPIIFAFFFTQRTFIEGIALTGLKG